METSHSNYFDSGPKIGLVLTILVPDTAETKILLSGMFTVEAAITGTAIIGVMHET